MSFSIVILSKNIANLTACVRAIREAGETCLVIVVWDGEGRPPILDRCGAIQRVPGVQPFVFARNANIGIRAAGTDDVVLLNDDALLLTTHGLSAMAAVVDTGREGIVSAAIKGPAHPNHAVLPQATGFLPRPFVPFACVWLDRDMINDVGLLDERFVPGSCEDNDYCWRARNRGWGIGTYYPTVVDHETLPHTFRDVDGKNWYDLQTNRARFVEKWGFAPQ